MSASTTSPIKPRRAKVPEVETCACPRPATDTGLHVLGNTRAGRTRCVGCGETWAVLDAAVRPQPNDDKATP